MGGRAPVICLMILFLFLMNAEQTIKWNGEMLFTILKYIIRLGVGKKFISNANDF